MKTFLIIAALLSGYSQTNEIVTYDADALTGYELPGSPHSEPQVPDVHVRFPPLVFSCGGTNIREIPATEGVTVFRSDVPKSREAAVVGCLKKRLPGVQAIRPALTE